jgi:hypothetical protein
VKPAATVSPTESEIATVTYQLWLDNGCPVGSHEEDWFRAEAMLKNALIAKCEDSWAAGVVRDGKNERNRSKRGSWMYNRHRARMAKWKSWLMCTGTLRSVQPMIRGLGS